VADIKKRMAHIRAKYFPEERTGPFAARYLTAAYESAIGKEALDAHRKRIGEDFEAFLQRPKRLHLVPGKNTAALERAKEYFGVSEDFTLARIMAEVLFGENKGRGGPRGVSLYEIACARALMLREDPEISDGEVARRLAETGGIYKDYDPDTLRQIVREARLEYGRSVFLGSPRKY
jgi:hypothetical protein